MEALISFLNAFEIPFIKEKSEVSEELSQQIKQVRKDYEKGLLKNYIKQ